jgi:hypothetical protein
VQFGGAFTRYGHVYRHEGGSVRDALRARLTSPVDAQDGLRHCADIALRLSFVCTCLSDIGVIPQVLTC